MIDIKHKEDLIEIADKLGYKEQSMQLIEEMAELTQAISKYRRYNDTDDFLNLIEELADVNIVLEQVIYLLNKELKNETDDYIINHFNEIVDYKIKRVKKRIARNSINTEV